MRISVAIPTLNSERYIRQCLSSILMQDVDVEVLIQDGGSKDKTLEIAEHFGLHYPDNVRISSGRDKNEPDAVNKAFERASGDILAWLDSDDIYKAGGLRDVVKAFSGGADWVYGRCKIIDGYGREIRGNITRAKELLQNRYHYSILKMVDFIPQPATFFSKKAWAETGLLRAEEQLAFDYDYWLRLGEKYHPVFINRYLASWRAHSDSLSVRNIAREAADARRVARSYSGNPIIRLGQDVVYKGTLALYKDIA